MHRLFTDGGLLRQHLPGDVVAEVMEEPRGRPTAARSPRVAYGWNNPPD